MRIFSASRIGRKPARKGGGAEASGFMRRISSHIEKSGSSRKVGGANKGLGEAPKSCTRKEHESATNSIAKRGQGAIAPCRVKGQRPLWGLGQRPNCSASDQSQGSRQQRCRQRSVPAPNFARPQTRPPSCSSPQDSVKNHCFPFCRPCNDKNQVTWEATAKGSRGRPQTFVCFHCPLVASADAKPSAQH